MLGYTEFCIAFVPPCYRRRHLRPSPPRWRVSRSLQDANVRTRHATLLHPAPRLRPSKAPFGVRGGFLRWDAELMLLTAFRWSGAEWSYPSARESICVSKNNPYASTAVFVTEGGGRGEHERKRACEISFPGRHCAVPMLIVVATVAFTSYW